MGTIFRCVLLVTIIHYCVCPPVSKKAPENVENSENEVNQLEEMGIEYNRYLKQVVETLESDADFRRKLENAQEADIRSGKIAEELDYVNHNVRTKLDELKRQELERLRSLARRAMETEQDRNLQHFDIPRHIDHKNPHSFEIADLQKLIRKVTEDLEEADRKRRDEFKQYEMQKEFEQHEKLKTLDEEQQKKYKEELEQMKKKHMKHEPLHHPGSKQQLEEVWEKQDHMAQQEFDPKTFFYLHDLDGNGFWDQDEVKALFLKELDKLYQAGVPEDDMRERAEEMERMREHVFRETDLNRDKLISFEEFLQQTKKPEFERDQGWETLDQQQVYTPEEYAEFERRRQEEIQRLIKAGRLPPHPPGMMVPPGHPGMGQPQYQQQYMQQPQYGQHPNSAYQQPPQYPQQQAYGQQQYQQPQQGAPGSQGNVPNQQQQQQAQFPHPGVPMPGGQQPPMPGGQQPPMPGGQQIPMPGGQQQQQQPMPGGQQMPPQPPPMPGAQQMPQQPAGQPGGNIPRQPVGQASLHQPAGQVPPQQTGGQIPQQPIGQQVPIPHAQMQQAVPQPSLEKVQSNSNFISNQQVYDQNAIPIQQKQPVQPNSYSNPPIHLTPEAQKPH